MNTEFVNHNNNFDNLTKFDMYQANRKMMDKKVRKSKLLKPNNLLGCCMLCCLIAKPKTQLHDNGGSFVLEKKM